jgi:hypothetical protein
MLKSKQDTKHIRQKCCPLKRFVGNVEPCSNVQIIRVQRYDKAQCWLHFFDKIAKKAFREIIAKEPVQIQTSSDILATVYLQTDPGRIQSKRPGVSQDLTSQVRY